MLSYLQHFVFFAKNNIWHIEHNLQLHDMNMKSLPQPISFVFIIISSHKPFYVIINIRKTSFFFFFFSLQVAREKKEKHLNHVLFIDFASDSFEPFIDGTTVFYTINCTENASWIFLWETNKWPVGVQKRTFRSASVSCCKDNVSVEYLKRASKSVRA